MAKTPVRRTLPASHPTTLPTLSIRHLPKPGPGSAKAWAHLEKLLKHALARVKKVQSVPKSTLEGKAAKTSLTASAPLNCWPYDHEYRPCTKDPSRICFFTYWMCEDGTTYTTEEPVS